MSQFHAHTQLRPCTTPAGHNFVANIWMVVCSRCGLTPKQAQR